MVVRILALVVCVLSLAGCASTALDPAAKPQRLDGAEFTAWVGQVNRAARLAVATEGDETALTRIQNVFDAVASTVEEKPGEASWIVSEWRKRSGNIGTLFDYFRSRNYLLNYYFFERGSDLLVPLERDRYGLTLARESLDALFGSGDYVSPWIVDSKDFVFGTSYGMTPVVNRAKALNLYEWIREHFEKTTRFSGRLDFGSVMQVIAANEVAHATLMQRYGFSVESEFDATKLAETLPGLPVSSARQVHEFISDAASIGTDRIAVFAVTANMLSLLTTAEDGRFGLDTDNAYSPGAAFFIQSVQQILNRRGRNLDLEAMFATQAKSDRPLRRYASGRLSVQILEALGDDGYRDLVRDYRRYAQILIRHIASLKAS